MAEPASPYWRLDDPGDRLGSWQVVRRLPATTRPALGYIWQAAPRHAAAIAVLQLAAGATSAFGLLATTGVLEHLFAAGPPARRVAVALPALALVALAYAVRGALEAGTALAQARVVPAVRRLAEERLIDAGLRVELAAFDDNRFYDSMHRARDRGLIYLERCVDNVIELLGAALSVIAAAGSLGVLHPVLLPVLVISVLPEGWGVLRAARQGYASNGRLVPLNRRISMLYELATMREPAAEIRATQAAPFVLAEYRQVGDIVRGQEVEVAVAQARARTAGRMLTGLALGGAFGILGLLLAAGWIPLAVAGTAVIAIRSATAALGRLVRAANSLFEQGLYVADYQGFLADARARTRPAADRPAPAAPARIDLCGVSFRYPGSRPALRDITLTIHAGQTIALVGENGSGKTTLAKIIAGLYRPTAGRVEWDGTDLRDLDPDTVADRVMMVLQEPIRWPETARVNVRMGRHDRIDPDDRMLQEAARMAQADHVVRDLPEQWDTLLSKYFRGGQDLSGGQWQRLAVARGLFRDAPVLIWDEPTAPLDAKAEYAIYESLRRIADGRTVVLITHRLASVRNCDQIYLLHKGALAEQGSHDALIARAGRYAELHALQDQMYSRPWPSLQPH